MKKVFLICFSFICFFAVGQTRVTSSGISIQGVARDSQGNSFANVENFLVNIYLYRLDNNTKTPIHFLLDEPLQTDENGVFSYVFDVPSSVFSWFEQTAVYLLIGRGGISAPTQVFLDQKLGAVPYAIYAQNGAQTGMIIPFTGKLSDVPPGWVLCDGSPLPNSVLYDDLKAYVGNNVPDLRGVFLRGFGNINVSNQGPTLKAYQDDQLQEHQHLVSLVSDEAGLHNHQINSGGCCNGSDTGNFYPQFDNRNYKGPEGYPKEDQFILPSANHSHLLSGNTSSSGGNETRPTNYGVNYIIKI